MGTARTAFAQMEGPARGLGPQVGSLLLWALGPWMDEREQGLPEEATFIIFTLGSGRRLAWGTVFPFGC